MNPKALPFSPTLFVSNVLDTHNESDTTSQIRNNSSKPNICACAGKKQTSRHSRDKRRQRRLQARQPKTVCQKSKTDTNVSSESSTHMLGDSQQLPTNSSYTKKQRRRRRNKSNSTLSHAHEFDSNIKYATEPDSSSGFGKHVLPINVDAAKNHFARKERARTRRNKKQNRKDHQVIDVVLSSVTEPNTSIDLESSFPMLSNTAVISYVHADIAKEGFWNDCLKNKSILTPCDKQSEVEQEKTPKEDAQPTFYGDSTVPLTMLTSNNVLPNQECITDPVDFSYNIDQQSEDINERINSGVNAIDTNQMHSLSNVRVKWNRMQLSKMRQRFWEADRVNRQMRLDQNKKKLNQLIHEDCVENLSISSSSGFSEKSTESYTNEMICTPLNVQILSQSDPIHATHSSFVNNQMSNLEETCLLSPRPLHYIIQQCYLMKKNGRQSIGVVDIEVVLNRLIQMQDEAEIKEWKSATIDLYELFPTDSESTHKQGQHIISADASALNPLQLAIVLNLPQMVKILIQNKFGIEEDSLGRTPLMLSCELYRLECIEILLKLTVKPKLDHRESEGGNSAYHICCMEKPSSRMVGCVGEQDTSFNAATETMRLLFNRTPFPILKKILFSINNEKKSLLHLACSAGDLRLVDCILYELNSRGCNFVKKALNMKDMNGCVPFISAVIANERDVALHLLVSRFANKIDFSDWFNSCPLTIASSNCSIDMLEMLMDIGYNTNYDVNRALLEVIEYKSSTLLHKKPFVDEMRCKVIDLLIQHGANPHMPIAVSQYPERHLVQNNISTVKNFLQEQTRRGDAPLTIAVRHGDIKGASTMLSSHSIMLPSQRSSRRCDPLLRLQPDAYFQKLEFREEEVINLSLQSALVNSLFRYYRNQSLSNAAIAIMIYKRGVSLSQKSIQWLTLCLRADAVIQMPLSCAPVPSVVFRYIPINAEKLPSNKVGTSLNFLPATGLSCPYLQQVLRESLSKPAMNVNSTLEHDEFNLVVGNTKLIAHRSVVSKKSGKLAAAIHFHEAQLERDSDPLFVEIDLPLATAKILLNHIYHGSIVFGLKSGVLAQCHQLLDLALLAEEYLCPSLILECEMRLLKLCRHCVCRDCLVENNFIAHSGTDTSKHCKINIKEPCFELITPETALDVLAVAQQLEESSMAQNYFYETQYLHSYKKNKSFLPFSAARFTAVSVLLMNFKAVIGSESFLRQQECDKEHDEDRLSKIMLSMCLEELKDDQL